MTTITPLQDMVLIRPLPPETQTPGGLIIAKIGNETPEAGTVVAVGPGRIDNHGNRIPIDLTPGDEVLIAKYGGIEVRDGLRLYSSRDVLCVVGQDALAV